MDLARPVRGQDDPRRQGGLDRADLGDRDLEVRQDLEQVRLELLVGAVDLVDEQHRGDAVVRLERLEERPLDQELAAEDVVGGRPVCLTAGLQEPDLEHLARVVPLVDSGVDVQALVALEADQPAAERRGENLGELGLADAGLAFEQQRAPELERQEDRGRERAVGDVVALAEVDLDGLDGAGALGSGRRGRSSSESTRPGPRQSRDGRGPSARRARPQAPAPDSSSAARTRNASSTSSSARTVGSRAARPASPARRPAPGPPHSRCRSGSAPGSGPRTGPASGAGSRRAGTRGGRRPRSGPPRRTRPGTSGPAGAGPPADAAARSSTPLPPNTSATPEHGRPDDRGAKQRAEHAQHLDPDARTREDADACDEAGPGPPVERRPALPERLRHRTRSGRRCCRGRSPRRPAARRSSPGRPPRHRSPSRNAPRTVAAVRSWIRPLNSGQSSPGSIRSSSSCASRTTWRIWPWNANAIRVRRAANSSSSRTDHDRVGLAERRQSRPDVAQVPGHPLGVVRMLERRELRRQRLAELARSQGRSAATAPAERERPRAADDVANEGVARTPGTRSRVRAPGRRAGRRSTAAPSSARTAARRARSLRGGRSSISTMRRHSGYMSTFVTRHEDRRAGAASHWQGTPAPAPDSSAEASVTKTSASADGRKASVAAAWPGVQAADARRVDQRDAAPEERVRQADLDQLDARPAIGVVALGDPGPHIVRRDRLDDELAGLAPADGGASGARHSGRP